MSELRLTILKDGDVVKTLRYRAGSGDGSKDPCYKNHGWLPNGRYDVRMYANYPGTTVRGKAFWLSDKSCGNGVTRTELFIHTSSPWSSSRYYSNGCIKLTPTNIDTLYRTIHYHFPDVGEGGRLPFQLKVTD
ncbi:L,D-transpeptidase [Luteipulveratus halotolerans]|uniref:L,D-transpeptidase n=1 Tax=Luteipulveratus halotolerans TaxID=1631356 RepID=UPI000682F62A|nr:L,D-transpeptidase [Luteipulveratus halotolerans]